MLNIYLTHLKRSQLHCFKMNEMKCNDDKCHSIVANADIVFISHLNNGFIGSEDSVELLGVKIDNKLKVKTSSNYWA